MANGGDVFVLDMGEPVRIKDLAYRMINLMGLTVQDEDNPDGDIAIEYIGLRPAEKLYEELLIGSNVSGTGHPRILRADEDYLPFEETADLIDKLRASSVALDFERARDLLMHGVREYHPTHGIEDLIWNGSDDVKRAEDLNVVEFPPRQA